jgi:hypothetical protein
MKLLKSETCLSKTRKRFIPKTPVKYTKLQANSQSWSIPITAAFPLLAREAAFLKAQIKEHFLVSLPVFLLAILYPISCP